MADCSAATNEGTPCGMRPARGEAFCINHQPGADRVAAAVRAGQASGRARSAPSGDLLATVFSLTDHSSIQAVLDTVVRLTFAGRLPVARAGVILRACSIAARNFDATLETLHGPRPQEHEWFGYFEKVKSLLLTIDPLLDEAANGEGPDPMAGDG